MRRSVNRRSPVISAVIVLIAALGLLYYCGAAGDAQTAPAKRAGQAFTLSPKQERFFIRTAQAAVSGKLKDPDSAKFGDHRVSNKLGVPMVCGTVNSRNSFGAYAGASRYVAGGDPIAAFLESEAADFDALWLKAC